MKIVFDKETRRFTIPKYIDNDTFNKTGRLVDILSNSSDRKELLKRGYDPSVKPTQRVIGNKVLNSTKDSNGNKYVREYLDEDAVRKTANDQIMYDYINEKKNRPTHELIYTSKTQGFDKDNPNTHFRVTEPDSDYDYHGYITRKANINGVPQTVHNINGDDYKILAHDGDISFDTVAHNGSYRLTNKIQNINPLFKAIGDQLAKEKPFNIRYTVHDNPINVNGELAKHNANRKSQQRAMLYQRKLRQMFPDADPENIRDLDNVDWRNFKTQTK